MAWETRAAEKHSGGGCVKAQLRNGRCPQLRKGAHGGLNTEDSMTVTPVAALSVSLIHTAAPPGLRTSVMGHRSPLLWLLRETGRTGVDGTWQPRAIFPTLENPHSPLPSQHAMAGDTSVSSVGQVALYPAQLSRDTMGDQDVAIPGHCLSPTLTQSPFTIVGTRTLSH